MVADSTVVVCVQQAEVLDSNQLEAHACVMS